jgi:hypothetical protein
VIPISGEFIKRNIWESRGIDLSGEFPEEVINRIWKGDEVSLSKIYGWFFYIERIEYFQRYLNSCSNGVEQSLEIIKSSIYDSEGAAITALEHFLFEINNILYNLPKINI